MTTEVKKNEYGPDYVLIIILSIITSGVIVYIFS